MKRFNKLHQCPCCNRNHSCSQTPDGLIFCLRTHGEDVLQHVYLGESKDGTWGLYRHEDDLHSRRHDNDTFDNDFAHQYDDDPPARPARQEKPAARITRTASDFYRDHVRREAVPCVGTPARVLSEKLGIPESVFPDMPVRYLPNDSWNRPCYVTAERDGEGSVTGYLFRYLDGEKRGHGPRGLAYPLDWQERAETTGCVFVPEGVSDVLALTAMGLAAVGRPNATGGVKHAARLFANLPASVRITVLAENDRKEDGRWPGMDGARTFAAELGRELQRPVYVALPPDAAKDVRKWLNIRVPGSHLEENLRSVQTAGRTLLEHCRKTAETIARAPIVGNDGASTHNPNQFADLDRGPVHVAEPDPPSLRPVKFPRCPNARRVTLKHRTLNKLRIIFPACKKWNCRTCAPVLKEKWKATLTHHLLQLPADATLYMLRVPDADAWPQLYDRIRILAGRGQARHTRVVFSGGSMLVVTNAPLAGAEPCSPSDAAKTLRDAIDGMPIHDRSEKPLFTCRAWKLLDERELTAEWERIGTLSPSIDINDAIASLEAIGVQIAEKQPREGSWITRIVQGVYPAEWTPEYIRDVFFALSIGEQPDDFRPRERDGIDDGDGWPEAGASQANSSRPPPFRLRL